MSLKDKWAQNIAGDGEKSDPGSAAAFPEPDLPWAAAPLSAVAFKAGAGTVPKVVGSALLGANLSTWGTNDMGPNGNRLPATQRSGPGHGKEDFETEAEGAPPSLPLNNEWVVTGRPVVSVLSNSRLFRNNWKQNCNWNRIQRQLGTRMHRKLTRPLPQTMARLMQDNINDQSRYRQQKQSCKKVFLGAKVQSDCDVRSTVICCHICWSSSVVIIKFRLSTTVNSDDQI